MNKGIKCLIVGLAATGLAVRAHAANITVNWGAGDITGISLANGTPLPLGDLIEIGRFTGTPTVGNPSLANFTVFGTTLSGSGANPPGYFAQVSTFDEGGFGHSNIYVVAFNAATAGAATQEGIWTLAAANWVFPKASDTPNSTSFDFEELVNNPGNSASFKNTATKVYGGAPIQSTDFGASTYLPLQTIVPEPSTWLLVGTGLLGLLGLRRRS